MLQRFGSAFPSHHQRLGAPPITSTTTSHTLHFLRRSDRSFGARDADPRPLTPRWGGWGRGAARAGSMEAKGRQERGRREEGPLGDGLS